MGITSVNLASIPFLGSCDSTRLQMSAKQISQSLTHPNCDIPYVISDEYRALAENNNMGIYFAKDDGKVYYKNSDLLILVYKDDSLKIDTRHIPLIKKATGTFASRLTFCLNQDQEFKKGDIIYSYDCFKSGIPSYGYNVFTAYMPFMGFNHEDAITISESFAERARASFVDTVFIPIFEYTVLQKLYESGAFGYFPGIGEKVIGDTVCIKMQPKSTHVVSNSKDLKFKMMTLLKTLSVSNLLNVKDKASSNFALEPEKTKIPDGVVTGIKIHKKVGSDKTLVDAELENLLEKLHKVYFKDCIVSSYDLLTARFGEAYTKEIIKKHLVYIHDPQSSNRRELRDALFLIELEITQEHPIHLGDKLCNRYANKGVISLILPDELRPVAVNSKTEIDLITNPFGIFSRMNLSQLLEGMVGKTVRASQNYMREHKDKIPETLAWLNESVIKHFHEPRYHNDVNKFINTMVDSKVIDKFHESICKDNFFVEAPTFAEVNTKEIYKNTIPANEPVVISQKCLKYIQQKLKLKNYFVINNDIELPEIFCAPIYTMRLYKLTSHIISARDLGPVKLISKQPLRGRANSGGSRVGQMEINICLLHIAICE